MALQNSSEYSLPPPTSLWIYNCKIMQKHCHRRTGDAGQLVECLPSGAQSPGSCLQHDMKRLGGPDLQSQKEKKKRKKKRLTSSGFYLVVYQL